MKSGRETGSTEDLKKKVGGKSSEEAGKVEQKYGRKALVLV